METKQELNNNSNLLRLQFNLLYAFGLIINKQKREFKCVHIHMSRCFKAIPNHRSVRYIIYKIYRSVHQNWFILLVLFWLIFSYSFLYTLANEWLNFIFFSCSSSFLETKQIKYKIYLINPYFMFTEILQWKNKKRKKRERNNNKLTDLSTHHLCNPLHRLTVFFLQVFRSFRNENCTFFIRSISTPWR